jgi:hypothetical protein
MMNLSVWKYSKMAKEVWALTNPEKYLIKKISQLNLLATAFVAILSLYVTFVAIFEQNFLTPIIAHVQPNSTSKREQLANGELGQQQQYSFSANFFSIFLLWALALGAGRLFHHIRLPPLLGWPKEFIKKSKIYVELFIQFKGCFWWAFPLPTFPL